MTKDDPEYQRKLTAGKLAGGTSRLLSGLFRFMMKLVLIALFIGFGLFVGGFLQFTQKVGTYSKPVGVEAVDAIVVLTGGATRIATALDLLSAQKGRRLLISGVHSFTKIADIRKFNPTHSRLFDCCVDIERIATDTIGNATETTKWVKARGYQSLIVVTSAYHMPRTLVEFRRQMPDTLLVPYSVPLEAINQAGWWKNLDTLRLMLSEYLKYLGAKTKDHVNPKTFQAIRSGMAL